MLFDAQKEVTMVNNQYNEMESQLLKAQEKFKNLSKQHESILDERLLQQEEELNNEFKKTLIQNNEECIFTIDHNLNGKNLKFDIYNAFIGIIPNHPIMKNCIDKIVDNVLNEKWKIKNEDILEFSGPGVLGKEVNKYFNREEKRVYEFYDDHNYFKKYNVNFLNFEDDKKCGGDYCKLVESTGKEINIRNEFIKTIDNYYIFQNKNGNDYLKKMYNEDIKIYNLKEWTTFSQNILPYKF